MENVANEERIERVNLLIGVEQSVWLDQVALEIRTHSGTNVSRSEIVRAALSMLGELHKLAPRSRRLMPLKVCKSGSDLTLAGLLCVRIAAQ